MTIENLINIIDAKLINSPQVKKIESATMFPSKVEMGDLFFATDLDSVDRAIENGAYAIVFEGDIEIKDSEIAYLKVDSIKEASSRLLRYVLTKKEAKIYHFKRVELNLLKQISTKKSHLYAVLPQNFQKSFELILNSHYDIFITDNLEYAKKLTSNYLTLKEEINGYLISDSLLKSSFKLDNFIYQNIQLPPIFFKNLKRVSHFLKSFNQEFDIRKIRYSSFFKPYFIDNKLNILNSSQKVIIFVEELETIELAIKYLKENSRWTKSIAITPPKVELKSIRPFWVDSVDSAKEVLKRESFNYAFCYQIEQERLFEKITNLNLFT
jgi:ferrochelatase